MRSGSASSVERIALFDFARTVALDDEPVLVYLRGIADDAADAEFVRWAASGEGILDGHALAAAWATAHGVPEARRAAPLHRIEAWWSA